MEHIKALREYGLLAALVFVVTWQNSRINEIERRLYDCLDARIHAPKVDTNNESNPKHCRLAILPEPVKIKKRRT